jgi:hypothetical protein
MYVGSKRPRVMCIGCQSFPRKLITDARISCLAFDIHRSKLVVAK